MKTPKQGPLRGRAGRAIAQPCPQGLLLIQNGGQRNPWPRLLKYSKNHGVFFNVTHNKKAFSVSGGTVCFLQSETIIQTKRRHFIVFA